MKKSDLKTGYLVERRNGKCYRVILQKYFDTRYHDLLESIFDNEFVNLNDFDEELECVYPICNQLRKEFCIVKVYKPRCLGANQNKNDYKLIWERENKNKVEDVFNHLSFMYRGTTVTMETGRNGYNFYVYVLGNKRARAFMDKQKLEKSRFEEVINILVKQLDESILLAFKL